MIKMSLPREVFEDFLQPLQEDDDAEGLERDSQGSLIPTDKTKILIKHTYTIKKGSVIDKLFRPQELDPEP